MVAVQSAYVNRMPPAFAGLVKVYEEGLTGICETVAGIGFGLAVSQGVGRAGAIIGGTRLGFLGISICDITLVDLPVDVYARYKNMGILKKGQIWVAPAVAIVVGDPVHFVAATGVLTNTGGQGPINGARWASEAAGNGDFAIVELSGYMRSA